ncbi:MAG: primosomal protein N' [Spirochaetaceae bacterium]|nr:primosomal protein N' [Spirochaetaceae bacterium]
MYIEVVVKSPLKQSFTYSVPDGYMVQRGCRVEVSFGSRTLTAIVVAINAAKPADYEVKPINKIIDDQPLLTEELMSLAEWLAGYSFASLGEVLFAIIPSSHSDKERMVITSNEVSEDKYLTIHQQLAVQNILNGSAKNNYLLGVTGSGKTEVFFKLIEESLALGQSAIYLVPEIALSRQMINRIKGRFGDIALINSKQSPNKRLKDWRAMQAGQIKLAVGTRSAVFAPLVNLGLIIIDEEQDSSYKAASTPRYHARQVAMRRSQSGAKLVMGSATPSLEAYYAMQSGYFARFNLNERVIDGAKLPALKIIDMRREKSLLSKELIGEIIKTKELGKQSLILLNKLGFAYNYSCNCGFVLTCHQCSVALTYYKKAGKLSCHYCGYGVPPPAACPQCGSPSASYHNFGVEKIEEELYRLFSGYRILRLDSEVAKKKSEAEAIIKEFSAGKADILLGTQIIAKGFNFPHLRLVGLPMADVGLSLPDFRAAERTFSLISQVAGRVGRFGEEGLVLVQSHRPHNAALSYALANDVEGFYRHELTIRQQAGFPPFSRLIKILFRSKDEVKAIKAGEDFAANFKGNLTKADELLGPAEAPIKQIAANYRYQIILKTTAFKQLHLAVAAYFATHKSPSGVYIELENDPLSVM